VTNVSNQTEESPANANVCAKKRADYILRSGSLINHLREDKNLLKNQPAGGIHFHAPLLICTGACRSCLLIFRRLSGNPFCGAGRFSIDYGLSKKV